MAYFLVTFTSVTGQAFLGTGQKLVGFKEERP